MDKLYKDVEKAQKIAATFFIVSVASIALLILFYSLFEKTPLSYKNIPFPVVARVVSPGDVIKFKVDKCNKSENSTRYTITKTLQSLDGGMMVVLGSDDVKIEPGCVTVISARDRVPSNIPPGRYRLRGVSEIRGIVKPFRIEWQTDPFVVSSVK